MMDADPDREGQAAPSGSGEQSGSEASETASHVSAGSSEPVPAVDIHSYIGAQLRAVYDDIARQPIPDRFLDLMRRLE